MKSRHQQILDAPGLRREDLLPEGINDELDELRAEHLRLLQARTEVQAQGRALGERFEAEDEARKAALAAELAGEEAEGPDVTPDAERRAALAPVQARFEAVNQALAEHGETILATAESRREAWQADLAAVEAEDRARAEEALAVLADVERNAVERERVAAWIDRLYGHRGVRGGEVARWNSPRARLEPFSDFMAERGIDHDRLRALTMRLAELTEPTTSEEEMAHA